MAFVEWNEEIFLFSVFQIFPASAAGEEMGTESFAPLPDNRNAGQFFSTVHDEAPHFLGPHLDLNCLHR